MVQMKVGFGEEEEMNRRLFISHMVQMKDIKSDCPSDPTQNFISHMVQMKVIAAAIPSKVRPIFISHMVQMKEVSRHGYPAHQPPLYPTWFR